MTLKLHPNGRVATIWASANDTYEWATRPGKRWPCSQLRDNRIRVDLDERGDLIDFTMNGRRADVDATELNAFIEDAVKGVKK